MKNGMSARLLGVATFSSIHTCERLASHASTVLLTRKCAKDRILAEICAAVPLFMTSIADLPKRRWYQFRLRTLLIAVSGVCLYLACWFPTKTQGVADTKEHLSNQWGPPQGAPLAKAPLILVTQIDSLIRSRRSNYLIQQRHYYFWFFGGLVVKLPFTTQQKRGFREKLLHLE